MEDSYKNLGNLNDCDSRLPFLIDIPFYPKQVRRMMSKRVHVCKPVIDISKKTGV